MRQQSNVGVYALGVFFVVTLGIAFFCNRDFPVMVVASESSVGTWVSGVLLASSAATALVTAIRRGWYPWVLSSAFFILLAADERFMFHERMKEWIVFSYEKPSVVVRESPVIAAAVVGGWISWLLWSRVRGLSRAFLFAAIFLGVVSVILDIVRSAALWEELCKLTAEFAIACALVVEVSFDYPDR